MFDSYLYHRKNLAVRIEDALVCYETWKAHELLPTQPGTDTARQIDLYFDLAMKYDLPDLAERLVKLAE